MTNWNEAEHPRDDEGKFTYKNGGDSGSSSNKTMNREDILYPNMKNKKSQINNENISLGNYNNENLSREDILYPTMDSKKQTKALNYSMGLFNDYKSLQDPANTVWYTLGSFLTNWQEMKDANTKEADKYFHARANYNAAQQGLVGSLTANILSDLREYNDSYRNIKQKGYSKEYSEKDILEDQYANEEGRKLGHQNPTTPAYIKLKHLMPKGFPERYKNR